MAGAHENLEHAEHAGHAAASNKMIALLISVLALFLAFSETLGKGAQTGAISYNVEASNLWAFFQAKTIRITTLRTAATTLKFDSGSVSDPATKAAMAKQIDSWTKTADRYEDEKDPPEGRKQLMARARTSEHKQETAMARYHHYELASAAFQIGIVLASATIITSMMILAWIAVGLGVVGVGFTAIGLFAPHAVHLL
jgi:CCR4-NOT transcriptional regulation complex NOT5 subunit